MIKQEEIKESSEEFTFEEPDDYDYIKEQFEIIAIKMDIHKNGILYLKEIESILLQLEKNFRGPVGNFLIAYMKQTKKQTMPLALFVTNVYKAFQLNKFGLRSVINDTEVSSNIQEDSEITSKSISSRRTLPVPTPSKKERNKEGNGTKKGSASKPHSPTKPVRTSIPMSNSKMDIKKKNLNTESPRIEKNSSPKKEQEEKKVTSEERELQKCTFKPNISKGLGSNSRLLTHFCANDSISEEAELEYEFKQQLKQKNAKDNSFSVQNRSYNNPATYMLGSSYREDSILATSRPEYSSHRKNQPVPKPTGLAKGGRSSSVDRLCIDIKPDKNTNNFSANVKVPKKEEQKPPKQGVQTIKAPRNGYTAKHLEKKRYGNRQVRKSRAEENNNLFTEEDLIALTIGRALVGPKELAYAQAIESALQAEALQQVGQEQREPASEESVKAYRDLGLSTNLQNVLGNMDSDKLAKLKKMHQLYALQKT